MAPPGIMSVDEYLDLDNIRTSFKNMSTPLLYPPSSMASLILSIRKLSPSTKDLSPSVFHDHDYVLKRSEDILDSKTDQAFDEDVTDIATVDFEDVMACSRNPTGDAMVADRHGVGTTANSCFSTDYAHHNIAAKDICLPESVDTIQRDDSIDDNDFLQGLDDLDFDLNDFDPHTDIAMEDSFQHFMDQTLYDSMTHTTKEDSYDASNSRSEKDENSPKKEFFFKLLGLQAVSVTPHQSSCLHDQSGHIHDVSRDSNLVQNETHSSSPLTCTTAEVDDDIDWCFEDDFCQPSTISTLNSDSCITSVPSKMCSCAALDWKSSLLYSTAPACSKGRVETCLSTATKPSSVEVGDNGYFGFSHTNIPFSTEMPGTGTQNDIHPMIPNSVGGNRVSQFRTDHDADEFLRWLEDAEKPSSPVTVTTKASLEHEDSESSNFYNENLGDAMDTKTSNSPPVVHSPIDLDSFVDLENYATGNCSPSFLNNGDDSVYANTEDHVTNIKKLEPHEKYFDKESNYTYNSQLRFRLSLLDDLSKGFRNDRDLEKRDAWEHSLCQFDLTDNETHVTGNGFRGDYFSDNTSLDVVHSPLSPFSSSSAQSSWRSSQCAEDNLDLLGLFSDENSSMLMERSNVTVSSMALI